MFLHYSYKSKSLLRMPQCHHASTETSKCSTLKMQDIRSRAKFAHSSRKTVVINYYVATKTGVIQVCSTTFLSILGISCDWVQWICRAHLTTGQSPKENRGGDRCTKLYSNRRDAVVKFIQRLNPVESHYTWNKSSKLYLQSDLSMEKLWRLYHNENDNPMMKLKYNFFRHIFIYKFNISFKSPSTDVCSECTQLKANISANPKEGNIDNMTKLWVHKLRAKAFYNMLQQNN